MNTIRFLIVTFLLLLLAACADDGDGDGARTGTFIDSAVEGVLFTTATQSGTTDSAGTFTYLPGEGVSFYIGDILIGTAEGSALLTPLDFVPGAIDETDPEVTNILRFVQSLDDDNNPDNGITISAATAAAAVGQNLDFSPSNINFVSEAEALLALLTSGAVTTLIDAASAQAHFVGSLGGGSTVGTLTSSGADTGLFGTSFTADPALTVASSIAIQWRQDFPDSSFFEAAVVLNAGVITDVLYTWNDGATTDAAYAISCLANPFPFYTVGDCSQMVLDTIGQQVAFDATLEISTLIPGVASGPITVNGVLDY